MRRIGYVIGCVMVWSLVIVTLIGFIVKNGWPGAAFLAFIVTAMGLVIFCAKD